MINSSIFRVDTRDLRSVCCDKGQIFIGNEDFWIISWGNHNRISITRHRYRRLQCLLGIGDVPTVPIVSMDTIHVDIRSNGIIAFWRSVDTQTKGKRNAERCSAFLFPFVCVSTLWNRYLRLYLKRTMRRWTNPWNPLVLQRRRIIVCYLGWSEEEYR